MPQLLGMPTPSIWVLRMSKPRALKVVRLVSHSSTCTPVARRSASLTLLAPNRRICSLLTTLIDCGVSLIARSRLVAPLLTRLARWATTSTVSRSVAVSPPAWASCGADSAAPGSQAMARTSAVARRAGTSRESRAAAGRARKEYGERVGIGEDGNGKKARLVDGSTGIAIAREL